MLRNTPRLCVSIAKTLSQEEKDKGTIQFYIGDETHDVPRTAAKTDEQNGCRWCRWPLYWLSPWLLPLGPIFVRPSIFLQLSLPLHWARYPCDSRRSAAVILSSSERCCVKESTACRAGPGRDVGTLGEQSFVWKMGIMPRNCGFVGPC